MRRRRRIPTLERAVYLGASFLPIAFLLALVAGAATGAGTDDHHGRLRR